jgi:putative ABC transport system ATP-binding protein
MSFIELDNLQKTYGSTGSRVVALDTVSLAVEEGSFVGIVGPSGSGKSTLLTLLGALAEPTAGSLRIDDIDVYALGEEQRADFRREYIGFIFQAYNLIPYLTALENVLLPQATTGRRDAEQRRLASVALERVGLAARFDHLPNQLSGGEQERVAIARALVNRPPLLLADEPTGSLDSATSAAIMDLFCELNREGQTILMVTHNPENRHYFHRVISLRDGGIEGDNSVPPQLSVASGR